MKIREWLILLSEWFLQQNEFVTSIENMEKVELEKRLEKFYLSTSVLVKKMATTTKQVL